MRTITHQISRVQKSQPRIDSNLDSPLRSSQCVYSEQDALDIRHPFITFATFLWGREALSMRVS